MAHLLLIRVMLLIVMLQIASGAAAQQSDAEETPRLPSVFARLFPHPSGHNGYEEIVLAAESVARKPVLEAAAAPGATLAAKRRALADPNCVRALHLLRVGLTKPIFSPRPAIDLGSVFSDLGLVRLFARLLVVEQYVLLADGRTQEALDSLEAGLRLGHCVKGEALIGALVGASIDASLLREMASHIEQLSAKDCERLLALMQVFLAAPDPTAAALERERRALIALIRSLRDGSIDSQSFWEDIAYEAKAGFFSEEPQDTALEGKLGTLAADPAALAEVTQQFEQAVSAHYGGLIASLRLPPWQRNEALAPEGSGISGRLVALLVPLTKRAMDRVAQGRAEAQLLAVHAAIHRFRWEHDRLPQRLEEVRLGDLAIDPFTGRSLLYHKTGEASYELASAGPWQRDERGVPQSEQRVRTTLQRE